MKSIAQHLTVRTGMSVHTILKRMGLCSLRTQLYIIVAFMAVASYLVYCVANYLLFCM